MTKIKAELNHNPYLLSTEVKFNGQEPKINCQIEKYEKKPLKDWVDQVPGIFYDEMNGYDFDFDFYGTVPDFCEIKTAFKEAGVTPEQVRLFHRNELEDSVTKSAEIDQLLDWLRMHPNRKFDFDEFWEKNEELFEGTYPFIIIGRNAPDKMEMFISPESVGSAKELTNTNLSGTPILFFVEEENRRQIRIDLVTLMNRKDVKYEQLFFMIDPSLNADQVARVISDLGVDNPQIVNRYDDDIILSYFRNYPITEYVRNAIAVFEEMTGHIDKDLEIENRESNITNAGIHNEIDGLEKSIEMLKASDEFFVQRDNYAMPYQFEQARQALADELASWKNRKTKIVGEREAETAANEYSFYINKAFTAFCNSINSAYCAAGQDIDYTFYNAYGHAGIDLEYHPSGITLEDECGIPFSVLKSEFLKMQEISYQEAKNDFFGIFKKTADENTEPVRVVTSYLDQWRSKAAEIVLPTADALIEDYFSKLLTYYDAMAEEYHKHLVELIEVKNREKDAASAQLSDDEKRLQEDNDWLAEVKDQLQNIERG